MVHWRRRVIRLDRGFRHGRWRGNTAAFRASIVAPILGGGADRRDRAIGLFVLDLVNRAAVERRFSVKNVRIGRGGVASGLVFAVKAVMDARHPWNAFGEVLFQPVVGGILQRNATRVGGRLLRWPCGMCLPT